LPAEGSVWLIHINARRRPDDYREPWDKPGGLEGDVMFDLLMLLFVTVAFAGAIGYVRACASLTRSIGTASDEVR
jgi:hypothetical protein